jgi:hypothetical protein
MSASATGSFRGSKAEARTNKKGRGPRAATSKILLPNRSVVIVTIPVSITVVIEVGLVVVDMVLVNHDTPVIGAA